MSKALLDALESKLMAAVETIEALRKELHELKDERRTMEDKLRNLIGRIDQAGAPETSLERPAAQQAAHGAISNSGSEY
jgi:FtsZ-binding cell division protein ZapB